MGKDTKISWCDASWNPARGCTKVDADCLGCYMYRDSLGGTRYEPKQVNRTTTVFNFPLKYKETKSKVWGGRPLLFTASLTDIFHKEIDSYRHEIYDIIRKCPHLIFQILTKRPERINDHLPEDWGDGWDNVWLGTSIGSDASIYRADELLQVKSKLHFLSLEPLWAPVNLGNKAARFDWVITGGESGNDHINKATGKPNKYTYRECRLEWIESIVNDCKTHGVPVFVKQLGTHLSKELHLKSRHGTEMAEWPEHLQIQQFPSDDRY